MTERPAVNKARRTVAGILAGATVAAGTITGVMLGLNSAATSAASSDDESATTPVDNSSTQDDQSSSQTGGSSTNRSGFGNAGQVRSGSGSSHSSTRGS